MHAWQYVKSYKVQVSGDGSSWSDVDGGQVFTANSAANNDKVENLFASPVSARFVRIVVQTWNRHISMRSGVLVCAAAAAGACIITIGINRALPSSVCIPSLLCATTTTVLLLHPLAVVCDHCHCPPASPRCCLRPLPPSSCCIPSLLCATSTTIHLHAPMLWATSTTIHLHAPMLWATYDHQHHPPAPPRCWVRPAVC